MARERNRRIFLAAGTGIFQRIVQSASSIVILPMLLATLGTGRFGIWGAVTSLAWLHGLLDLGLGAVLVTHLARAIALDRIADCRRLVAGALGLGTALGLTLIAVASTVVIAFVPQPRAALYLTAVVAMGLNIPLNAANSAWLGLQKGHISGFWDLVQTVLTAAALVIACAYTVDVRIYVAVVYGGLLLSNVASLVHLIIQRPDLVRVPWSGLWSAIRNVAGRGGGYFLLSIACALSYVFDNVLALELLGPEAAARMAVAVRICITSWGVLEVMSLPLWPAFSEAGAKADQQWIRKSMLRGAAAIVGSAAAGALVLIVFGGWMLEVWLRTSLGIDRSLLVAIAAWVLAQAINRVPNVFLNASGVVGFQFAVNSIATLVAYLLKFTLAPTFGVAGILWGTTAATLLIVFPSNVWRIFRWQRSLACESAAASQAPRMDCGLLIKGSES